MKRIYTKPILNSEAFIPSEYVAACFNIACNYGAYAGNMTEGGNKWVYCEHVANYHVKDNCSNGDNCVGHGVDGNSGCGVAENQYIRIDDKGNTVGLFEKNSLAAGGGSIPITEVIFDGSSVTWTSTSDDGRAWHHKGTYNQNHADGNHS